MTGTAPFDDPLLAPRQCWICDLIKLKPPIKIEILGTIVRLNQEQMTVDDGTGSVVIHFEGHAIKGQIGENVDCIARFEDENLLRAETVIWKVTPGHETLFQWQILSPPGKFGYPTLPFTKVDLLRYIRHAGSGATLEDLALVIDRTDHQLRPMIHELQNDGAIYQNREGEYVLL
eukprot:CAMPEP_0119004204 /NCGR_PEP_ID=MMETSP1176-20130426/1017_1 /TAXON_ID=265551 /ORGANISM="Synedropsis recta cf, Strain CCMP1620" /LENGTH=174 /DNA_ID=CAMNT_0006955887 /DNA_START=10 /DNA_END=534 /DNA_ORIENTATION=+